MLDSLGVQESCICYRDEVVCIQGAEKGRIKIWEGWEWEQSSGNRRWRTAVPWTTLLMTTEATKLMECLLWVDPRRETCLGLWQANEMHGFRNGSQTKPCEIYRYRNNFHRCTKLKPMVRMKLTWISVCEGLRWHLLYTWPHAISAINMSCYGLCYCLFNILWHNILARNLLK